MLNDHSFSSFDEYDWNEKWNNAETQQFFPRSIKEINSRGDISSSKCFIKICDEHKYVHSEASETFSRFGYVQNEEDKEKDLTLLFPVNRIRNICFRVTGKK